MQVLTFMLGPPASWGVSVVKNYSGAILVVGGRLGAK